MFEMNSLNQFGFGTVGDWICSELCGIRPLAAGYKKFVIEPRPVIGVSAFKYTYETVYGRIICDFTCQNGMVEANIKVPVNTTAVISLPDIKKIEVGSGEYKYRYPTTQT